MCLWEVAPHCQHPAPHTHFLNSPPRVNGSVPIFLRLPAGSYLLPAQGPSGTLPFQKLPQTQSPKSLVCFLGLLGSSHCHLSTATDLMVP